MFAVYSVHNYYEVCVGPKFYLKRVLSAESAGGEASSPVMMCKRWCPLEISPSL